MTAETDDPDLGGRQSLPAWFEAVSQERGSRVAMRWKRFGIWESITWQTYGENARACGSALLAMGLPRGACVAVMSENRPEWAYADFAAQGAGCVAAGIYASAALAQVVHVLNDCAARVLFVEDDEQLDKALSALDLAPALERIVCFEERALTGIDHPKAMSFANFLAAGRAFAALHPQRWTEEAAKARPDDAALIIYTSGTTGPPKGAMLSHRNIIFQMRAMEQLCPGLAGDDQLSFLPLSHIVERYFTIYRPLDHGAVVNIGEGIGAVMNNLREVSPHCIMAVPRIWEKLYSAITMAVSDATWAGQAGYRLALNIGLQAADCRLAGRPMPLWLRTTYAAARAVVLNRVRAMIGMRRARLLISGAAPIAPELIRWYYALGLDMVEAYGQTECTGHAASYGKGAMRLGTVGKAIAGTELRLSGEGEILVKGPHVFLGYLNQGAAAAPAVRDGWLHTGDVGRFDADGYLTVTDRLKDIIVTAGGKNITPSEIETRLKFSPCISDAIVIGDGRSYLTCLIMMDADTVMKHAQDHNIPFTNFASLARSPSMRKLIQAEVDRVNQGFSPAESIRKFELIDVQLTADDEELTPTLKLKRKAVSERFGALIQQMYA